MHSSACAESEQYASHSSFPLHAGGLTPFFRAVNIFSESFASSGVMKPAASANVIQASMWSGSVQYTSHASLPLQGGGTAPLSMAMSIFLASSSSLPPRNPAASPNVMHSFMWLGSSQY